MLNATLAMFRKSSRCLWLLTGILLSGCVLPGGDRPVGAMRIQGRLANAPRESYAGKEIVVIRRYFDRQKEFNALYEIGDPCCNPVSRHVSAIGADGRFSLELPGFLSGDPIWIIPPLGTLMPLGTRADKQGLQFLLKTPEPAARVYEIDARRDDPRVRQLKGNRWRFRKLSAAEAARIRVAVRTVTTNLSATFSMKTRVVEIELMDGY
ncbi:MAG TPA: hypothetical protein PLT00_15915 [Verrucomicrobiota bacterium]|nr:MAG: hypothetical protein BWX84_00482 [Verrucomicrobia bacterium ADurb.Bin118]HPY32032.1 hypothetical protein [Verrucomicrobiota bacterium]HQB18180.1 hypothetical protein [Verrucomicrobiota bacterium]